MKSVLAACVAMSLSIACAQSGAQSPISGAETQTRTQLDDTHAAQIAAMCIHWPDEVISHIIVTNWQVPSTRVLPHFDFPDGRSVMISARGTCGNITPAQVVPDPSIPNLGPASVVVTGMTSGSGAWIVLVGPTDENGARQVICLAGTVAGDLTNEPEPQSESVTVPVA